MLKVITMKQATIKQIAGGWAEKDTKFLFIIFGNKKIIFKIFCVSIDFCICTVNKNVFIITIKRYLLASQSWIPLGMGNHRGLMVKILDCSLEINEF